MRRLGFAPFLLPFLCWTLLGQQVAAQPAAAPRISDAQASEALLAVSRNMTRLGPMLEQVRVSEWVAKGAPQAYVQQLAQIRSQIDAIRADMATLAQHPAQMQDAMRALFRIESLRLPFNSMLAGLRKYQNPALAELIDGVAGEDEDQILRLQRYVLQLAGDQDQQYRIVDNEAQRCRATLSRQPAPRARTSNNQ